MQFTIILNTPKDMLTLILYTSSLTAQFHTTPKPNTNLTDYQANTIRFSLAAILGQIVEIQFPSNHAQLLSAIRTLAICQTAFDLIDS
jgi:hypothetical protein